MRALAYSQGVQTAREFSPYGEPLAALSGTDYGFTGAQTDGNGLEYLRVRYLNSALGTSPLTWNGYGWVGANVTYRGRPVGPGVAHGH